MRAVLSSIDRTIALAVGFVAAGFVAITIAWIGVSATVVIPTQVAFAVSGGMGGFALAGTGAALFEIQRRRRAAAEARRDLTTFAAALGDVAELLARRATASVPTSSATRPRRRVLRAR